MATEQQQKGTLLTILAFSWWGLLVPLYFKLLSGIDAYEILSHRIIWSLLFLILIMLIMGIPFKLFKTFKNKKLIIGLVTTSILISVNWLISVWAITHDQILATSLGYFINPLISILLGVLFLGESLNRKQSIALFLVLFSVINQIWQVGEIPWVSLGLAFSFGFYGLIRKKLVDEPYNGLLVEIVLVFPIALFYLLWLVDNNKASFLQQGLDMDLILIASGIVTTLPMVLFVLGSKLIRLSTVGFLQYLAPSLSFVLAIMIYNEPLGSSRLISFVMIWAALLLISIDAFRDLRKRKKLKL